MEIPAALAADLALLTQALDEPGADIAATLRHLVGAAGTAVHSYLGLTVDVGNAGADLSFTTMDDLASLTDVHASLMMPLHRLGADGSMPVVVILYAGNPGAFVDLAADLSWLTGLELVAFDLDQHLHLPAQNDARDLRYAASSINQAIGVLIERGWSQQRASDELDVRATEAGHSRYDAAKLILGSPADPAADQPPS